MSTIRDFSLKLAIVLLCVVTAPLPAFDSTSLEPGAPVAADDPLRSTLNGWKTQTKQKYAEGGYARPAFSDWRELKSQALTTLFPQYRFFHVQWNELPTSKHNLVSLVAWQTLTLACHTNDGSVTTFVGSGNYENYGRFLAHNGAPLRTIQDATLIWNGFCDLRIKGGGKRAHSQKSPTVWHLGSNTIGDFHYYYRVNVSTDGIVRSAKLHADKVHPSHQAEDD